MIDAPSLLQVLLAEGLAACRATVGTNGSLFASLFLAGLVGSVTHCAGMCGPFVLAQTVSRLDRVPAAEMREFHRLAGAALAPCHLGRATTYASLGAAAAALTGGLVEATEGRWLSVLLLTAAALFFLAYAARGIGLAVPGATGSDGLIAVGTAGHVAGRRFRGTARALAPALMLVNAAALSDPAWRLASA